MLNPKIELFKYIQDKDVFQKHYSKMLAKRLVFGTSIDSDSEAGMIQRLGSVCGLEYTQRLSRMFQDMSNSRDLTRFFIESRFYKNMQKSGSGGAGFEFHVNVLTSGSWPLSSSKTEFIMSPELTAAKDAFSQYYLGKYNGRRLNWEPQYSKVDVRTTGFGDKAYEVNMPLHMYAVLDIAFNNGSLSSSIDDVVLGCRLEKLEVLKIVKVTGRRLISRAWQT